ncbi:hypothetical protein ARMGADRAFT_1171109, partial [Armillaria gallica]
MVVPCCPTMADSSPPTPIPPTSIPPHSMTASTGSVLKKYPFSRSLETMAQMAMPFVCQPPRSRSLVMSRLHTISTPPASSPPSRFTTIAFSTVHPHFRGCRSKHCCLSPRQDRCRCRRSAQLLTFPTNHGPPTSTAAPT